MAKSDAEELRIARMQVAGLLSENRRQAREYKSLVDACGVIVESFEKGTFVRDITHDGEPAWAIRMIGPLRAVATLVTAVDEYKSEGGESGS